MLLALFTNYFLSDYSLFEMFRCLTVLMFTNFLNLFLDFIAMVSLYIELLLSLGVCLAYLLRLDFDLRLCLFI